MTAQEFADYAQAEWTKSISEKCLREVFEGLGGNFELARAEVLIMSGNEELVFSQNPELAYQLGYDVPGYTPPEVELWD